MLDLDGTLLNNASQITADSKRYLKQLKDKHHIVLITGRPYRGCVDFYNELELTSPLICDNGATIIGNGHFSNIYHSIPKAVMDALYEFSKAHIVTAFFSVDDKLYAIKPQQRLSFYFHLNETTKIIEKPYTDVDDEAPLLMIVIKKPFHKRFEAFVNNTGILTFRSWGEDKKNAIYEVYLKDVHKGNAMREVMTLLNVAKEDVIAFGDGNNDVELIKYAHIGVAMKNAASSVIKVADIITEFNNNDDGVIKQLKRIIKD